LRNPEDDELTEFEESFYYQDIDTINDFDFDVLRKLPNNIIITKAEKRAKLAKKGDFDMRYKNLLFISKGLGRYVLRS
jgi:hypothetical protein